MSKTIPPDELDSTRAVLEPTLKAVADILPLLAQARAPRFPPELSGRWQACCRKLAISWSGRHCEGLPAFRSCVFGLCALAVELNDGDCLALSEALASASDLLEDPQLCGNPRLLAAISAACECLDEDNALEHPLFGQRSGQIVERLRKVLASLDSDNGIGLLLKMFADEADEHLREMEESLDLLPPDAYAIKSAAAEIVRLAEPLELYDIMERARLLMLGLTPASGRNLDIDDPETRERVMDRIVLLKSAIDEMISTL